MITGSFTSTAILGQQEESSVRYCEKHMHVSMCGTVFIYHPQVSKRGYTYPNYAWIFPDWYIDNWWTAAVDGGNVSCTDQELETFLEKTLALQRYLSPESNTILTDAGIVRKYYYLATTYTV